MTWHYRIRSFFLSFIMILIGVLIVLIPVIGSALALMILGYLLLGYGIGNLIYYGTMARYMIGGKLTLCIGIIMLDSGLLFLTQVYESNFILGLLLQGVFGFYGVIALLRAREAKKNGSPMWKFNLIHAAINLMIVALAFISRNFTGDDMMLSYLFAIGMFYSAAIRIYSAMRRTAIVYIQ